MIIPTGIYTVFANIEKREGFLVIQGEEGMFSIFGKIILAISESQLKTLVEDYDLLIQPNKCRSIEGRLGKVGV